MFLQIIRLIRVKQWYKNVLVFAALFFSGQLFSQELLILTIIGFLSLCFVSSANYIVNDIIDRKKDRDNPKKPIARKKISLSFAIILSILLYASGLCIAKNLGNGFLFWVVLLIVLTNIYSVFFKKIMFLDILSIAFNFVIRALAGVALISVPLTPWFFLTIFFTAAFLVSGKRRAEVLIKAKKVVIKKYDAVLLLQLSMIFLTIILILFGLYSHFSNQIGLLYLVPVLLFSLLRVYYHIYKGDIYARQFEKMIFDYPFLISAIIFAIATFVVMYI